MKPTKELQVQGPLDFAIVDEIDNILIDEARTPLIISGPAQDDLTSTPRPTASPAICSRTIDFEVKEKEHTCHLTDDGIRQAEELAGVESFYTAGNMEWPHLIDNSLKAHYLYKRDVNYVVENGEVVIVDEHTGRKMEGRQWSDGLHQAVEAKEGVKIKEETQTLATITLQNYFKLYQEAGRHDRYGHDRSERVPEDLQAGRRRDSDQPPDAAHQSSRHDLPHAKRKNGMR